jgi:hypothetical protein
VLPEINGIDRVRVRFKGEQVGWSPQGLHETEIQFTDLTETDASSWFVFLVIIRNNKEK